MKLLLSGEGMKDLGKCNYPHLDCEGGDFAPGPMAWIVDHLAQNEVQYSFIDTGQIHYLSETTLKKLSKRLGRVTFPGGKNKRETAYFRRNAIALGRKAKEMMQKSESPVIAVLFRDADGTCSSPDTEWTAKRDSMMNGFSAAGFDYGVPMIPKPKSEAWLLCALKKNYRHCDALEMESGNDASPNSLKKQLQKILGDHSDAEQQTELVRDGKVNAARIDMPSYNRFRDDLQDALRRAQSESGGQQT